MGHVKQALLEREERWQWRLEQEEERRWEPDLPDSVPEETPDASRQDGVHDPFIFETGGSYATSLSI